MTPEEILLKHWSDSTVLNAIIPAKNVFAGPVAINTKPFVCVICGEIKPFCSTSNAASPVSFAMHLELNCDSFDTGSVQMDQIISAIDTVRISSSDQRTMIPRFVALNRKRIGETHWVLTAAFDCFLG